eukprot:TRINITY_DN5161_c0_g5_i1.p1 TRINITY_DN5161_c0_g5~~TRINITY_DN5161_c0_g5_i1.p1  ORF type:complete len:104 (-),score=10.16 TRINITY_DN5161_c0_g5_i1:253-564(-)
MTLNSSQISTASTELNTLTSTIAKISDLIGPLLIDSNRHSFLLQYKFPEFTPFHVICSDSPNLTNTLPSKKSKIPPFSPPLEPDPPPAFDPLLSYSFNDCFGI